MPQVMKYMVAIQDSGFSLNPPGRTTREQYTKAIQLQQLLHVRNIMNSFLCIIKIHTCKKKTCITFLYTRTATYSVYLVLIFDAIIYSIGSENIYLQYCNPWLHKLRYCPILRKIT